MVFDLITRPDMHRRNNAGLLRANAVLHFHRFQHAHLLPCGHPVAGLDFDSNDDAGYRRQQCATRGATSATASAAVE